MLAAFLAFRRRRGLGRYCLPAPVAFYENICPSVPPANVLALKRALFLVTHHDSRIPNRYDPPTVKLASSLPPSDRVWVHLDRRLPQDPVVQESSGTPPRWGEIPQTDQPLPEADQRRPAPRGG
jgi:hypothetical protein